jgi:DNA-binding NtrC family response regulator
MKTSKLSKYYNLPAPILIIGETGTGKSRLAKNIFDSATIYKEKFLTLHLASIKEELFESELFGHKKGSFTGAVENKNGYLKEVGSGTLFLDEIGELSMDAQKKLLYLLEEKKFVPVGDVNPIEFRGRIIFATNRNLELMVKKGEFREDLYYRLMIFQIKLSPLRDDQEDLKNKINFYFNYFKKAYACPELIFDEKLQCFLKEYKWPGNVRELKNCLESMVGLAEDARLKISDLPFWMTKNEFSSRHNNDALDGNYSTAMDQFEEAYLRHKLVKYKGRINETARCIQISKVNLINKAKKYQINTLELRVSSRELVVPEAA